MSKNIVRVTVSYVVEIDLNSDEFVGCNRAKKQLYSKWLKTDRKTDKDGVPTLDMTDTLFKSADDVPAEIYYGISNEIKGEIDGIEEPEPEDALEIPTCSQCNFCMSDDDDDEHGDNEDGRCKDCRADDDDDDEEEAVN
jgi:hypothetical protein